MKLNWAERWAVNNPLRPLQQRLEIRWMRKRVQLKPGAIVAELGCGRGVGACILKEKFHPQVLQAMDLDVEMIQRGRKHLSSRRREGISFFVGDVIRLPYRDATLDAIFGFGILHHIPDWQGALAEIARVLKIDGVYFMEELYPPLYQNFITKHILLHPRVKQSPEIAAAPRPEHPAVQDFPPCHDYFIKPVTIILTRPSRNQRGILGYG